MKNIDICYNCENCKYDSCGDGYCIIDNTKVIDDHGCKVPICFLKIERKEENEK